jgi:hypothetical protein
MKFHCLVSSATLPFPVSCFFFIDMTFKKRHFTAYDLSEVGACKVCRQWCVLILRSGERNRELG